MKFLVINGHKYYPFSQGRLNKTIFEEIIKILQSNNQETKSTIIENGYDLQEEIDKFRWADIIIFQSPVNWFSVPWTLKKYFDYVYQHGIFYTGSEIYGEGGLFKGKKYMYSMTCNPREDDFDNPNSFFDGKSPEDFMAPLHKMQQYCGMEPIKSFFCFDVVHNPDIPKYLENLRSHMRNYVLKI